ncbi:MAG TPA: hypothetical protein VKR52_05630 [Terracidiphilus sp.]|nr:hypothetical protein [Terracidiphilus sp.]
MPVSRSLLRLLRVRELEEEQCRSILAAAAAELILLESARDAARERARRGRSLMVASAQSGDLADRIAGAEEVRCGVGSTEFLSVRIRSVELRVAGLRQRFLVKRTERRQAETLIEDERQRDAVEQSRKSQQALDEWHRTRQWRAEAGKKH